MSVLGNRIKSLRKSLGLSQEELATAINTQFNLNIDRVMISKWETNFQTPVMNTIVCLAKFFNVSIDYLNGNENVLKSSNLYIPPDISEDFVTFPVIGEVAAGYDHIAMEDWTGDTVNIPQSFLKGRNKEEFFVLRITGDSMYPAFQNGDKVLVLRQTTLNHSGQIGVVIYNGDAGTIKKIEYVSGEDWMKLIPINPNYPPVRIEGAALQDCRVIGIPKLLIREIEE